MSRYRILPAVILTLVLTGAFVAFIATQRPNTPDIAAAIADVRTASPEDKAQLEDSVGLTLRENPADPPISRANAVMTALEHEGVSRPSGLLTVSRWIADRRYPRRS